MDFDPYYPLENLRPVCQVCSGAGTKMKKIVMDRHQSGKSVLDVTYAL